MEALGCKLFAYKAVVLSQFTAHQFTVFEHKRLFSIIFYYFKGAGWQGRFHSHAFNALSLRIFGDYLERGIFDNVPTRRRAERRWQYIPRDHFHELGRSNGCLTLVIAGPWAKTWQEVRDGVVRTFGWGRKVVQP